MDAAVLVFWARKARSVSARSAQHCPAPVLGAWRLLWRFRQVHSRYLGSSACPVTSRNTGATGLTLVFFFFSFPGQSHVSHSIPGSWGLCFWFCWFIFHWFVVIVWLVLLRQIRKISAGDDPPNFSGALVLGFVGFRKTTSCPKFPSGKHCPLPEGQLAY